MRTLADVKRRMVQGSRWRCIRVFNDNEDMGVREIAKARTNAVAFRSPGGKLSWLWWPEAKEVRVEGNTVTILKNGIPALRYEFVE